MREAEVYEKYQVVIGLEVHAQLLTKSKAWSADRNEYGALPNTNVSAISLGHPGTLPMLNKKVVEHAIKLGLALNCDITRQMHFARKNYFYADLPKGYQITQDATPICTRGKLEIKDAEGKEKVIGITRIHMEEDAGKSIHDQDPFNTLIDLNRAGVPLLEIVSEPDLRSSQEAYNYLVEIRKILRYLEICDGNMEEGSMRCDANISVMLKGTDTFGKRCEVKNMNSMRNVQRAIEHEMKRQIDIIEAGGSIEQETRNFDAVSGTTSLSRSKEEAHDYRYFPEPDLQPLSLAEREIEQVFQNMPPLPQALFNKYVQELSLSEYDAALLTESKPIALYFEELITKTHDYKGAANWMMGEVKSYLNQHAVHIEDFALKPESLAALMKLVEKGIVSRSVAAQTIFPLMIQNPEKDPQQIAEEHNLVQKNDDAWLEALAQQALEMYPEKVKVYKAGNKGLMGLFMGEVMKLSERKANPKAASDILKKLLDQ